MAYIPTIWNDGDIITAEKLNNLEQGVLNEQVGPPGKPGTPGKDGEPGKAGADGATFVPSVSADGMLSWTNNGGLQNPAPVSIKGPPGEGISGTMVNSFNGRTGNVAPSDGDYTAAMVGARPSDWMPTAADVHARPDNWMPTAADVGAATIEQVNTAIQSAVLDSWGRSY